MAKYVGAIDQKTTSTRFMIFDHEGREVARHHLKHEQIRSGSGWVEHDPHEIWEATQDVIEAALGRAGITADDLAAIGITNQRETTVVWDRRTGETYCNAIVRRDIRDDREDVSAVRRDVRDDRSESAPDPAASSSGSRLQWILANVDGVKADADAGHAIFGTIDTWLIWWLTGGPDAGRHITDVTNAGNTTLMDLKTWAWDEEVVTSQGIPLSMLPEIRSSSEVYGHTTEDGPFSGVVVVASDLGDRQAAMLGQACFKPGDLRVHGAGDVLMLNTGTTIVRSGNGVTTTVAHRFGQDPAVYALEGSIAVAATHDQPSWEAMCHQIRVVVDTMTADADLDLQILRVDGGTAADDPAMQILADVLGVTVSRPVVAETSTLGSAYAAGLAVGFWAHTDELAAGWNESTRWEPASTRDRRDTEHAEWKRVVGRTQAQVDVG